MDDAHVKAQVLAEHRRAIAAQEATLPILGRQVLWATGLVNGLAATGTFTLLASFARDRPTAALLLLAPLSCFGFGFATALFATGWTYLQAESRAAALRACTLSETPPYLHEGVDARREIAKGRSYARFGLWATVTAMAAAVAGFLLSAGLLIRILYG